MYCIVLCLWRVTDASLMKNVPAWEMAPSLAPGTRWYTAPRHEMSSSKMSMKTFLKTNKCVRFARHISASQKRTALQDSPRQSMPSNKTGKTTPGCYASACCPKFFEQSLQLLRAWQSFHLLGRWWNWAITWTRDCFSPEINFETSAPFCRYSPL